MKKINITITGALGRMGKILIKRISKNSNLKLFSLTDLKSGKTVNRIKIQKNNLEAFKKTDIIIDFSKPKVSFEILNYAKKLKKKVVIGTTGFTKQQNNLRFLFLDILLMRIFPILPRAPVIVILIFFINYHSKIF